MDHADPLLRATLFGYLLLILMMLVNMPIFENDIPKAIGTKGSGHTASRCAMSSLLGISQSDLSRRDRAHIVS